MRLFTSVHSMLICINLHIRQLMGLVMSLYRLAYMSEIKGKINKDDLRQILSSSVTNNTRDGVTGALLFNQSTFLQILEGRRPTINKTYRRITQDGRHRPAELIGLEPAKERLFSKWSMALINDEQITREILIKYCGADKPVSDRLDLDITTQMMCLMLGSGDREKD